jgi:hypothetical protein
MNLKIGVYLLTLSILISCGQRNSQESTSNNNTVDELQKKIDSIAYENYINNIDYTNIHSSEFRISDIEENRDTSAIFNLLEQNIHKIFKYDISFSARDLVEYTYLIDLNNDGEKDIVYQGISGSEPFITVILMNRDDEFVNVFSQYQSIHNIIFKDKVLSEIEISNPGCCADPQVVYFYYKVDFKESHPEFTLYKTIGHLEPFEKPDRIYDKEKSVVITDQSLLRNQCFEVKDPDISNGEFINVLGTYKRGAKGQAIGEKKVKGVMWICVLMDESGEFNKGFFPTFAEQPTQMYGWIKKDQTNLQ